MSRDPDEKRFPEFELRKTTRGSLQVPVTILISGWDVFQAKTGSISMGGFFVALPKPPPVGILAKFTIDLKGEPVRGVGRVAWIRLTSESPEKPAGMGLQFRHLLDDDRLVLRRLLTQHSYGGRRRT